MFCLNQFFLRETDLQIEYVVPRSTIPFYIQNGTLSKKNGAMGKKNGTMSKQSGT